MRRLAFLLAAAVALAVSAEAGARIVEKQDREGRPIRFDVRAQDVDVEWFADLLRNAAHGDEITGVTVRIVPSRQLRRTCGRGAGACYGGDRGQGTIVVPSTRSASTAHSLIHEYGHHIDRTYRHRGLPEPNGTSRWWQARKMGRNLKAGRVAFDYSLGWARSIGEIFAEDYTQLHFSAPYKIAWLEPPGEEVRNALRRDLEGVPEKPASPATAGPLVIQRRGTIAPGERRTLPFRLLGPGRKVVFTARVAGVEQRGVRARTELVCGSDVAARDLRRGQRTATIRAENLGPASCEVALVNASSEPRRYVVKLLLSVEE